MKTYKPSSAKGFTLIELIITVAVISTVMIGATAVMPGLVKDSRADASSAILLNALRLARDRAIGERRNMDVIFIAPNEVKIVREEIVYNSVTKTWGSSPTEPSNPTIMDVFLEDNQRFQYFTGMDDTPDKFGRINVPVAFPPLSVVTPTIMFTSEGTLVDVGGDPINGTVFLGTGGDVTSARAITIFGPTAAVRLWKWNGKKWME